MKISVQIQTSNVKNWMHNERNKFIYTVYLINNLRTGGALNQILQKYASTSNIAIPAAESCIWRVGSIISPSPDWKSQTSITALKRTIEKIFWTIFHLLFSTAIIPTNYKCLAFNLNWTMTWSFLFQVRKPRPSILIEFRHFFLCKTTTNENNRIRQINCWISIHALTEINW